MKMLRITLEGKTYDVGVEVLDDGSSQAHAAPHIAATATAAPAPPSPVAAPSAAPAPEGGRHVTSPMAGQVFKCLVKPGDAVTLNQVLIVLDAMKMETPVVSPFAGTVRAVLVSEGDAVDEGRVLVQLS